MVPGLAVQVVWKGLGTELAQSWRCCLYLLGIREALSMLDWNVEGNLSSVVSWLLLAAGEETQGV